MTGRPLRVAAVDCGTNSTRLLVADAADGRLTEVARRMEITRLGEGVDRTRVLAPQALERTRLVLSAYAAEVEALGVRRVRVCATSATRDAANRHEFAAAVRDLFGVDPEVLAGQEEAALSFAGAVDGLPAVPQPLLVVDIGGGSTEFVLGDTVARAAVSVDVGCVRLTERHLTGSDGRLCDPPSAGDVDALTADVEAALDTVAASIPVATARTLVGLAGTVTTTAALALALPSYDERETHHASVPFAGVQRVAEWLVGATHAERSARVVIHPGRVDVLPAGALLLATIMARLRFDQVLVSEHDILDGVAMSLAGYGRDGRG